MQPKPMNHFTLSCINGDAQFEPISNMTDLKDGEAFVILLDIEALKEEQRNLSKLLNVEELNQVYQYKRPSDQLTKLFSRAVLKQLIAKLLKIDIAQIGFQRNEFGKPSLKNEISANFNFNLSDSNGYVVVAFSFNNIGVDIEERKVDLASTDIVHAHFCKDEQFLFENIPNQVDFFYTIWTRKEAMHKACGIGLTDLMHTLNVTDGTHWGIPDFLSLNSSWNIVSFRVNETHTASIAVPQSTKRLYFFDYLAGNLPPF